MLASLAAAIAEEACLLKSPVTGFGQTSVVHRDSLLFPKLGWL
jgi:hypothetical protein